MKEYGYLFPNLPAICDNPAVHQMVAFGYINWILGILGPKPAREHIKDIKEGLSPSLSIRVPVGTVEESESVDNLSKEIITSLKQKIEWYKNRVNSINYKLESAEQNLRLQKMKDDHKTSLKAVING